MKTEKPFKSGFVALAGRSNVGKSTLLNALVGEKLSIVTPKIQTTRFRLTGVAHRDNAQIMFVDAPGLHRGGGNALNRVMNRTALQAITDADVVVFVVECQRWTEADQDMIAHLQAQTAPVIVAANKIDQIKRREGVLPHLQRLSQRMDFAEIVPISARRGTNLQHLEQVLLGYLPEGPPMFARDQSSDRDEQFHTAELVREQAMLRLQQELPYGLQVSIENFQDKGGLVQINAILWVERAAHKAIVIGRQGQMLKSIGTAARHELESRHNKKVNLELWVKVRSSWSNNPDDLHNFGFLQ